MTSSTTAHEYDDPAIGGMDFLLAVMRDVSVPLAIRIQAAAALLPVYRAPPQVLTIRITGGLGELTHEELVAFEARAPGDVLDWNDSKHSVH
jgi:hypothetical protein